MRPPTKLQIFANFWPKKCYNLLSSPPPPEISRLISARLFSVSQFEIEVKRTPLCGCCWDPRSHNWWIKGGPKRGIFGSFSETVGRRKSLYICHWSLFWKKGMYLLPLFSIFKKKSVLKLLDRTVYSLCSWNHTLQKVRSLNCQNSSSASERTSQWINQY